MERLGLECLSAFGQPPVEFIRIAGELGCGRLTRRTSILRDRRVEHLKGGRR